METKKDNFRNPMSPRRIVYSKSGEKEQIELALEINKETGEESFYIKGKTNIYEKIQAHKDECNLGMILERCKNMNDYTDLNQVKREYGDLSEVPTSYIEAHAKITKLQDDFTKLPLKIRAAYDNSFSKFLANIGKENWMKVMGFTEETEPNQETETKEKEENENE